MPPSENTKQLAQVLTGTWGPGNVAAAELLEEFIDEIVRRVVMDTRRDRNLEAEDGS